MTGVTAWDTVYGIRRRYEADRPSLALARSLTHHVAISATLRTCLRDFLHNLGKCVFLQTAGIAVEFANAFGEFLRGSGIFVVHPAEGLFLQMQMLFFALLRLRRIKHAIENAIGLLQLIENFRADREQVCPGQLDDLVYVSKTRPIT